MAGTKILARARSLKAVLIRAVLIAAGLLGAGAAAADAPQVTAVRIAENRYDVTLLHPDTGWDHYADAWEVLDADGNRLGIRELLHPHVNEQPFTRSQTGIVAPEGATFVFVRARCSRDGWSENMTKVPLPD